MRGDVAENAAKIFFGVPAQVLREVENFARERGVAGDFDFLPRGGVGGQHAQRDARRESKRGVGRDGSGCVRDFAGIEYGQRDGKRRERDTGMLARERPQALARP